MQIKDLPSSNTLSSTDVLAKDTSGGITQKITGAALAEQLQGLGNYLDTADVYDGLDKSSAGFVLDARQGKVLNDTKADQKKYLLHLDDIEGTTQSISFDSSGNVQSITHTQNNTAIRTDVFTYGTNTITETRTLNTNEKLTIATNLATLVSVVTYTDV